MLGCSGVLHKIFTALSRKEQFWEALLLYQRSYFHNQRSNKRAGVKRKLWLGLPEGRRKAAENSG
jgi:hypothetical protein